MYLANHLQTDIFGSVCISFSVCILLYHNKLDFPLRNIHSLEPPPPKKNIHQVKEQEKKMRKLTVDSDIVADCFFSFNFGS